MRISGSPHILTGKKEKGTRGMLGLVTPFDGRISLAWKPLKQPEERTPAVSATINAAWIFEDAFQHIEASANLTVMGAPLEMLSIQIPPGSERFSASGPDVREISIVGNIAHVYFKGAISGRTSLRISYDAPRDKKGGTFEFPGFTIVSASERGGYIVVCNSGTDILLDIPTSGVELLTFFDIPLSVRALAGGSYAFASYVPIGRLRGLVDAVSASDFPVRETLIKSVHYVITCRDDGNVMLQVRYDVLNNRQQHMALRLPEGVEILQALVSGKPVKLSRLSEDRILVPLTRSLQTFAGFVSFPVIITYTMRLEIPQKAGDIFNLALPSTDVPIAYAACELYLPDNWYSVTYKSPLKQVSRFSDETAEEHLRFSLAYSSGTAVRAVLGRNYYQAALEAYAAGDLEATATYLNRLFIVAPESGEAKEGEKILSNIRVLTGKSKTESRSEKALESSIRQEIRGMNQMLANIQEQSFNEMLNLSESDQVEQAAQQARFGLAASRELARKGALSEHEAQAFRNKAEGVLKIYERDLLEVKKLEDEKRKLEEEIRAGDKSALLEEISSASVISSGTAGPKKPEGEPGMAQVDLSSVFQGQAAPSSESLQAKKKRLVSEIEALKLKASQPAKPAETPSIQTVRKVISAMESKAIQAMEYANKGEFEKADDMLKNMQDILEKVKGASARTEFFKDTDAPQRIDKLITEAAKKLQQLKQDIRQRRYDISDILDGGISADAGGFLKFIVSNYAVDQDRVNVLGEELIVETADASDEIIRQVIEKLRSNAGQKVGLQSVNIFISEKTAEAAGVNWNTGKNNVRYAVIDRAQLLTLNELSTPSQEIIVPAEHQQVNKEVVVGTFGRIANGRSVSVSFSSNYLNKLIYEGNDVQLPFDKYFVISNGSYVTVVNAGRMRNWTEEITWNDLLPRIESIEVPRIGTLHRFEKTLIEAEDYIAIQCSFKSTRRR